MAKRDKKKMVYPNLTKEGIEKALEDIFLSKEKKTFVVYPPNSPEIDEAMKEMILLKARRPGSRVIGIPMIFGTGGNHSADYYNWLEAGRGKDLNHVFIPTGYEEAGPFPVMGKSFMERMQQSRNEFNPEEFFKFDPFDRNK
jgi:7-cyano-7-deazaguanine synthase in queuosine biosynthesis